MLVPSQTKLALPWAWLPSSMVFTALPSLSLMVTVVPATEAGITTEPVMLLVLST
ncbi:hypothetical protein D3C81_2317670 [compost metagenome]